MAEHTPGPWRADLERDDYEIDIVGKPSWPCNRYGVKGEWDVAHIEVINDRDDETRANARLIAAAPDLLKALTDILSNHETAGAGASIFQCTTQQVVAARAAVARAMGGAHQGGDYDA